MIVGAIILFFAFYFIGTNLGNQGLVKKLGAETTLDILWDPFSSFGSLGATASKEFVLKTREKINFDCSTEGDFGYNSITILTNPESGINPKVIYDKYIFSEKYLQGAGFQVISKPFEMPWRIADLVFFIPKNETFCFKGMNEVKREFGPQDTGMNISNFEFPDFGEECTPGAISICESGDCDIEIDFSNNKIRKGGESVYFAGDSLMYAAIFSDPEIYKCNLVRLAKRIKLQTEIYSGKAVALNSRGCDVSFSPVSLENSADLVIQNNGARDSIIQLNSAAESLSAQNYGSCNVF